jgi:hypothetical protein
VSVILPISRANAQTDDAALSQFTGAVEKYLALQRSLRSEVPALPDELEYRFVGNDLIRDGTRAWCSITSGLRRRPAKPSWYYRPAQER